MPFLGQEACKSEGHFLPENSFYVIREKLEEWYGIWFTYNELSFLPCFKQCHRTTFSFHVILKKLLKLRGGGNAQQIFFRDSLPKIFHRRPQSAYADAGSSDIEKEERNLKTSLDFKLAAATTSRR